MTASKHNQAFYQCTQCGTVHKIEEDKIKITDDLYSSVWCPHCRDTTKQLWVGSNPEDIIELYDVVLDERYYKTK